MLDPPALSRDDEEYETRLEAAWDASQFRNSTPS